MSILDQVRKNQFQDNISRFNPTETINTLFFRLSEKERDIVRRRFGLGYEKSQTLEEIGRHYGITRERVRQIESISIKKLKELKELKREIENVEKLIVQLLEQYGGVMEESFFLENILSYLEAQSESERSLLFLAEYILSDNVTRIKPDREFNPLWRASSADLELLKMVVNYLIDLIKTYERPIILSELIEKFKISDFYREQQNEILSRGAFLEATDEDANKILESYLRSSRLIKPNLFNEWGLVSWGTVQPKKINDKIYLVMKKIGQPMHFNEIAQAINETKFDEKIAYPATVHNELILDDKYVLIGRGIYALKEWGYQNGTVSEVIENLIKENGQMTKEEIMEKVLAQRQVKKSTIYLSLMNNKRLKKIDGKYSLAETAPESK